MNNEELREEILRNRDEVQKLAREFYVFKGKAFGFLSLLSIIINLGFNYIFKK